MYQNQNGESDQQARKLSNDNSDNSRNNNNNHLKVEGGWLRVLTRLRTTVWPGPLVSRRHHSLPFLKMTRQPLHISQ